MANELELSTTIHASRADVYTVLRDVEGYTGYSPYVDRVARYGDGDAGTEYDITVSWWRLSYTARVRVTDLEAPNRLAWRLVRDLDARGEWCLEPATVDDPTVDEATAVTLTAWYEPETADHGALSLPPLVSMAWVVERVRPLVEREVELVLARVVEELENEPRQPTLEIRIRSDAER